MRILLIEDYGPVRKFVSQGLAEAGFVVDATGDAEEGLAYARSREYDVLVLDLMLPKIDGLTILRRLREEQNPIHVLILTAKDTVRDRVEGLNLGADDYLIKPFAFEELLARVNALVRRKYEAKSPAIRVGDLEVDTGSRAVRRGGQRIELTAREYALIEYLALRAGQVVTRAEIWNHLYEFAAEPNSNVIEVFINRLRKKLEGQGCPRLIQTRRDLGYVLEEST
jgi:DNA-binding response OmpR family regulator